LSFSAAFSFTFSHRYSFEYSGTQYYDGGVIEISTDNGATWADVGAAAAGYPSRTLFIGSGNVLGGRTAFAGASASYPSFITATVSLGTTYANKTVLIRFRITEDDGGSGNGWDIDNLVFTGLTNTPFSTMTAHPGCFQLYTVVSPSAAAGTISPATGLVKGGSIVTVNASAKTGYTFANFSGALTGSANPQNLTITGDASVAANFTKVAPALSATLGVRSNGTAAGTRVVPITLTNIGAGPASNATITSVSAVVLIGTGAISVASGVPVNLGGIAVGGSASSTMTLNWPATATRVTLTIGFTADGYSGSSTTTVFR